MEDMGWTGGKRGSCLQGLGMSETWAVGGVSGQLPPGTFPIVEVEPLHPIPLHFKFANNFTNRSNIKNGP